MSACVAVNGVQGATTTCTHAPGLGSWSRATRSVSARIRSTVSTIESGASAPWDSPMSIDPRAATMRTPNSCAACTSASIRPVRPCGNT